MIQILVHLLNYYILNSQFKCKYIYISFLRAYPYSLHKDFYFHSFKIYKQEIKLCLNLEELLFLWAYNIQYELKYV